MLPPALKFAAHVIDMLASPALQIIGKMKKSLEGRAVGFLVDDGSNAATIDALRKAAEDAGATVKIVSPKIGGAVLSGRRKLPADGQLAGTLSVVFDAVTLVLSQDAGANLAQEAAAVDWVRDTFGNIKVIACDDGARPVLAAAGIEPDAGVVDAATPPGSSRRR